MMRKLSAPYAPWAVKVLQDAASERAKNSGYRRFVDRLLAATLKAAQRQPQSNNQEQVP